MAPELVTVDKKTVVMSLMSDKSPDLTCDVLTITNVSKGMIYFKMKTNNFRRYVVRPNLGTIDTGCSVKLEIMMKMSSIKSLMELPEKDKFLLLAAPCTPGSNLSDETFREKHASRTRIRVRCGQANGAETGSRKNEQIMSMSENPVASIDKQKLALRPSSESKDLFFEDTVHIFNKSTCDIAYKVLTTAVANRRQFRVQPAAGIVKPGSTESILFTMHATSDSRTPRLNEVRFRILTATTSPDFRKLSKTFWSSAKKSQTMWSFDLATDVADANCSEEKRCSRGSVLSMDYSRAMGDWQDPETCYERKGFCSGLFGKKDVTVKENNTNDDLMFRYDQSLSTSETQQQVTLFSTDSARDNSNVLTSEVTARGTFVTPDVMPTDPYSLLLADEMKVNRLLNQVKKLEKQVEDQNMEMSLLKEQLVNRNVRNSDVDTKCSIFSCKFWRLTSK